MTNEEQKEFEEDTEYENEAMAQEVEAEKNRNMGILVLDDHNFGKPPIGKIKFNRFLDTSKVNWDKKCFGAGYKPLEINEKGEVTKAELLEISLIDCPAEKK